jgi:KaiC/GvpD/RAD55 family RecA-like ATPase
MERVSTGIIGLDQLLRGGLPAGSMSLVLGVPGSGKSTMGKQFLYEALIRKTPALLLDTNESFDLARETMVGFEWDRSLLDIMIFVDCYSWRTGASGTAKYAGTPKNLTDLSLVVRDLLKREVEPNIRARIVIDSFSDFLIHAGPDSACKFLESLKARLAERKVTSVVILEDGLHEPKVNASVEYIADGTIRMRYEESGRSLMVSRMLGTPVAFRWVPFSLARGIELAAADYFR